MEILGRTPEQWEERLAAAAGDVDTLAQVLAELEHEMRGERHWLHDNPEPEGVIARVLEFFGRDHDGDIAALGRQIDDELRAERHLKERYRTWLPGETYCDVLFPYLKSFGDPVAPDATGLQFPGFTRCKGARHGSTAEMWVFYVSDRYPGREPANFHVVFSCETGELTIKRVYKMELPRIKGISTVGRAVLADMIRELVPDLAAVGQIEVDNAANQATREGLLLTQGSEIGVQYAIRSDADPQQTPLGHLMHALAVELGLRPGAFHLTVGRFGTLRIELEVSA